MGTFKMVAATAAPAVLLLGLSSLAAGQWDPSPLMEGNYIQRDIYPDARKMADEYNAAWYNEDEQKSIAGNELRFSPLASGDGVVVSTGEGELELRYNTTVADTSLLAGLRMEVFSCWQGEQQQRGGGGAGG